MPLTRSDTAVAAPAAAKQVPTGSARSLAARIASEPSLPRRAQMLTGLVALNSPAAAAALAGLIGHADAAVRGSGVDGLRRIGAAVARPALAALLASPSPDVRIRALDAIDRVPDAEIEAWLIALLGREPQHNVCALALDLLADMGTPTALPVIREVRLRFANEPFVAFAADHALCQIARG